MGIPGEKGFVKMPSGPIPGAHGNAAETAGSSSGATGKHAAAAAAKAAASAASGIGVQAKRPKPKQAQPKQAKHRCGLGPADAPLLEVAMHACKLLDRTMATSMQASACGRPLTRKEKNVQDASEQHVRACFIRVMQRAQALRNIGKTHGGPLPPVV